MNRRRAWLATFLCIVAADSGAAVTVRPLAGPESGNSADCSGLEVHLAPHDRTAEELVYACGASFEPPPGIYRVWLEGAGRMSPYSLLTSSANPQSVLAPSVGDAGRVTLPKQPPVNEPSLELQLLHAGSYVEGKALRWELSRSTPAGKVGDGILMPAGKAIAALWNPVNRSYVALSRPFEVRSTQAVEAPLEQPAQGSAHLVVQLLRLEMPETVDDDDVELSLHRPTGGVISPALKVATADKVFAVWYGLEPGSAELRAATGHGFLSPQLVNLQSGRIERVTAQLVPLPALEVALELPAPLHREQLGLKVKRLPSGEVVAQHRLEAGRVSHRFEKLPPALLAVELATSLGPFTAQADLSSGADGFVLLKPDLITVHGKVYYGDDPHPAKLEFTSVAQTTPKTETNEEGEYEVVSLKPLRSVSIVLEGEKAAPYLDIFFRAIAADKELDFHIPAALHSVKVLDAKSSQPIREAHLAVRNEYADEEGEDQPENRRPGEELNRTISQSVTTDEDGLAWLPPLRKGILELRAFADGYFPMQEPLRVAIGERDHQPEHVIALEPMGETVALRLLLPNGAAAGGAEIQLVDSLASGMALFSSRADPQGLVRIPRSRAGYLLAKHRATAFLVREWMSQEGEGEVAWSLPAAAERPLTIRVKDSSGKNAAPRAELALWVGGRRLTGGVLFWLAGAPPTADLNGFWTAKNLPQGPVAVLAWSLRLRGEALAGTLDGQATPVPYPWPETVEIRALE